MAESFWVKVKESNLQQGDYLTDCAVPIFRNPKFTPETQDIPVDEFDLIVLTQSCDLEQNKVRLVAMCPIFSIEAFEQKNPEFKKKGRWNEVRKGRMEGLHMLGAQNNPTNNREAFVVDFREIYSLPDKCQDIVNSKMCQDVVDSLSGISVYLLIPDIILT